VAFTTLKIAVFAPIPSVRVANTVKAIRGDFRIVLSENCTSFNKLIWTPRRICGAETSSTPEQSATRQQCRLAIDNLTNYIAQIRTSIKAH
jgi:hypothetical protein